MAKYRPDADIAHLHTDISGAATRYGCVNEATASDSQYVKSDDNQTDSYFHVGLPDVTDPHNVYAHTLSVRSKLESNVLDAISVQLRSGETTVGTWNLTKSESWVTQVINLTPAQANTLAGLGYADLSVYVALDTVFDTNSYVSWIEFETPDGTADAALGIAL